MPNLLNFVANGVQLLAQKRNLVFNRNSFEHYALQKFKEKEEGIYSKFKEKLEIIFYDDCIEISREALMKENFEKHIRDYINHMKDRIKGYMVAERDGQQIITEKQEFLRKKIKFYLEFKRKLHPMIKTIIRDEFEKECQNYYNNQTYIKHNEMIWLANKGEDWFKAEFIKNFGENSLHFLDINITFLKRLSKVLDINEFFRRNQFLFNLRNFFSKGITYFLNMIWNRGNDRIQQSFANISKFHNSIDNFVNISSLRRKCSTYKQYNANIWYSCYELSYEYIFNEFFDNLENNLRRLSNNEITATFNACLDETVLKLIFAYKKFEGNNGKSLSSLLVHLKFEHELANFNFQNVEDFQNFKTFSFFNRNQKRCECFEREMDSTFFYVGTTSYLDTKRQEFFPGEKFYVGTYF